MSGRRTVTFDLVRRGTQTFVRPPRCRTCGETLRYAGRGIWAMVPSVCGCGNAR
jgi:predicted Zn-ribbon and HTH transcriptional regulator